MNQIIVSFLILHTLSLGLAIWTLVQINENDYRLAHLPSLMHVLLLVFATFGIGILAFVLWRKKRKDDVETPVYVTEIAKEAMLDTKQIEEL